MQLNLARKWRSKHFDEVIGQELAVRLVKNSLYRNLLFPVYLLAGTRGSGKTTMARLFGSALNCAALPLFQTNPQQIVLPCLECPSCKAMQVLRHPDFIEIDAASHTGVDNVRQIIDAASFMPAMGQKRVYLIDEAHMLSKAAFNALLKILEEPPASALFILATTDPHKIPDTIKSRCFQLFFQPIPTVDLTNHLIFICKEEGIAYDAQGLQLIVNEAEGSVRDALNLIERVRLINNNITHEVVLQVLGFIDEKRLYELLRVLLQQSVKEVLVLWAQWHGDRLSPHAVLKRLLELIRVSLWVKQGLAIETWVSLEQVAVVIAGCSLERLIGMLEICYAYEPLFAKTASPQALVEMMLIHLCTGEKKTGDKSSKVDIKKTEQVTVKSQPELVKIDQTEPIKTATIVVSERWEKFLSAAESLDDPMMMSIFRQAVFKKYDAETNCIELGFGKNVDFFQECLGNTKTLWTPLLERAFKEKVTCVFSFMQELAVSSVKNILSAQRPSSEASFAKRASDMPIKKTFKPAGREISIDIQDAQKWHKAHSLLRIFPGTMIRVAPEVAALAHSPVSPSAAADFTEGVL